MDFEYSTLLDYLCIGMLCVFGIACVLCSSICLTCKKSVQQKKKKKKECIKPANS